MLIMGAVRKKKFVNKVNFDYGEMAQWFKAADCKSVGKVPS